MWVSYSEDTSIWVTAENACNKHVSWVENDIIARLRDKLGTARNANETCGVSQSRSRKLLPYCLVQTSS